MTKNPFVNALIAIAYIAVVASFMYYGGQTLGPSAHGIIVPTALLCLFVLSAALMGITFFYEPAKMYLDGDKNNSLALITKTILIFAIYTVILLAIMAFLFLVPRG
jgi:hypothetical protein